MKEITDLFGNEFSNRSIAKCARYFGAFFFSQCITPAIFKRGQRMNREYQPLKLIPNRIYPTNQLHAQVANLNIKPDDAMIIANLEVIDWLRLPFRAFEITDVIKLP